MKVYLAGVDGGVGDGYPRPEKLMRTYLAGLDGGGVANKNGFPKHKQMRAYLAGQGPEQRVPALRELIDSLMAGHPYRLVSYLYIRDLPDPGALLSALVDKPENLIVDSGLYSFMFGSEQGKLATTYEAYRDYTRRYLDDMDQWGAKCLLVESDAHRVLGMDATHRLREEFKPLGDRVMYVWHEPEGLDGLIKLAREKSFVCVGLPEMRFIAGGGQSVAGHSGKVNRMVNDLLRRIHKACGDRPPRIHLLGCTVTKLMQTHLAWSCDSTSWLSGLRYGNGCIWRGELETGVNIRSERFLKFRELAMDANPKAVDYARAQDNVDYYLNALACAHAYAMYQRWLDTCYSPIPMRGDQLPGGAM